MKFRHLIIFLLISLFWGACRHSQAPRKTYVGGKIVHPVDSVVMINRYIYDFDSSYVFRLDSLGRFGGYIPLDSEEVFFFANGNQLNMCYLHPGDSLLIYTNTLDFDRSLQFSGKGADFNNLLADITRIGINEVEFGQSIFPHIERDFFINSINQYQLTKKNEIQEYLNRLPDDYAFTPKEELVLNYNIYFPDYFLMEEYRLAHPSDSIAYRIPFHFSWQDTYHPLNYFLLTYGTILFYRKMNTDTLMTARLAVNVARHLNREVKDSILADIIKYQLITQYLGQEETPPSPARLKEIHDSFPRIFYYPQAFEREFRQRARQLLQGPVSP